MTDKEKLTSLLQEFGIEFEDRNFKGTNLITCREGMQKVGGYGQFFADFEFAPNGDFIQMGVWE